MFYVSLVLCFKKIQIQAWSETGKLFSCNILCTWQREDLPTPVSPSITILTQCIGASSSSGLGSGSYTPPRVKVPRSCNRYYQTFFFFSNHNSLSSTLLPASSVKGAGCLTQKKMCCVEIGLWQKHIIPVSHLNTRGRHHKAVKRCVNVWVSPHNVLSKQLYHTQGNQYFMHLPTVDLALEG